MACTEAAQRSSHCADLSNSARIPLPLRFAQHLPLGGRYDAKIPRFRFAPLGMTEKVWDAALDPSLRGLSAEQVDWGELNSLRQKSKIFATSLKEGGEVAVLSLQGRALLVCISSPWEKG